MQKYLLILLGLFSTTAFAAIDCSSYGGGDYVCYEQHQKRLAAQLNKLGKELERVDKPTAKRFYIAQKDWKKFVESNCQYESEPARNSLGAGHYRVKTECIAKMYEERFNDVNKMVQWRKNN